MTRDDILNNFKVDQYGVIRTQGKFESEPVYAPHFWELMMESGEDEEIWDTDGTPIAVFIVTPEDRAQFPEIGDETHAIAIWEDSQGFIGTNELTEKQLDRARLVGEGVGDDSEGEF